MMETIDDLLNELIKYPLDTKIRIILNDNDEEIVPGLYKIMEVKEIKMSAETSHLELGLDI